MFTGIITDIGTVQALEARAVGVRMRIQTRYEARSLDIGASIACNGCCVTVVKKGGGVGSNWFEAELSPETLKKTTLGELRVGDALNLERALKIGDELGGHLVTGHVDAVAHLLERSDDEDMTHLRLRVPEALARFIAPKGSVTLQGTSLTVNEVDGAMFSLMLIPHTLQVTTWGSCKAGDRVNIEVDLMARYAARLACF